MLLSQSHLGHFCRTFCRYPASISDKLIVCNSPYNLFFHVGVLSLILQCLFHNRFCGCLHVSLSCVILLSPACKSTRRAATALVAESDQGCREITATQN